MPRDVREIYRFIFNSWHIKHLLVEQKFIIKFDQKFPQIQNFGAMKLNFSSCNLMVKVFSNIWTLKDGNLNVCNLTL